MAELLVQMYVVYHPDLSIQAWQLYVAYLCILWLCVVVALFGNRYIPYLQHFGLFMVVAGGIISVIVVAAMPTQHASNAFVWTEWTNITGWSSGVAFLTGVLNGAFTIGTPDSVTHMAEELPNPKVDIPKAIAAQIILGGLSMSRLSASHRTSQIPQRSHFPIFSKLKPLIYQNFSVLLLRHHHLLRHNQSRRRNHIQRFLSYCRHLLPSYRLTGCNLRPALHHFPFPSSLPHRHYPHRLSYLVGPCPR